MTMLNKIRECYKKVLNDPAYTNVKACNFLANDGFIRKRVYLADVMGLDHTEHLNCHVNLSLYYDTHLAMTISFATKADAWKYVESKGKIDRRIIKKTMVPNGWKLTLKKES